MTKFYTLETINEFFNEKSYSWTGQLFDEITKSVRPATESDLNQNELTLIFFNHSVKLFDLNASISNFEFILYDTYSNNQLTEIRNYTKDWCKFLLKKYKHNYAIELYSWILNKMMEFKKKMLESNKSCDSALSKNDNRLIELYEQISYLPMEFLTYAEINDLTQQALDSLNIAANSI